jgi:hypothetical protein
MAINWFFFRFLITAAAFSWIPCSCISLSTSKQPEFITTVDEYQKLVPENLVKYSHMTYLLRENLEKLIFTVVTESFLPARRKL